MNSNQLIFAATAFASIGCLVYFVMSVLFNDEDSKLKLRLRGAARHIPNPAAAKPHTPLILKIGQAASRPFMPASSEKQSDLRRNLARAGIYSGSVFKAVVGAKVILMGAGLAGGYLVGAVTDNMLLCLSVGGIAGYLLPTVWLKLRIKKNQRDLEYGLADAIDLMVVCVEAGMTVDSAMQRVGAELAPVHPAIGREFGIAHMETRVGLPRAESLRNLGVRTGCTALQSLTAMLIQAERLGTSIAQALRIHAQSLRDARHFRAEELAAKSAVKMSFPLVLFIFPATFIVLAGPTVIQLLNSDLFK